ncbi:hypothetical protein L3081_23430 [Colwellia sp. MSW7]|uniref:Solute-binding protein family 3/N-terminal domain-containing protein n=1 Tax=Colwellia maritima TaxID=2912588 RepID=A0ABS9X8H9_9GAMM|nr:hypothetical protein [Colwellia maritima]MCI2285791.1 hypothetical protein [Colwellia maritima]
MLAVFAFKAYSVDIVKLQLQQYSKNKAAHNSDVIRRALEITEPEYGAFDLQLVEITMSGGRMILSGLTGKLVNTLILPGNARWDKQHIAIRIPIRLGLLGYRLLLINKVDLPKFEKINTLQELKELTAGLTNYWETTKILKHGGYKVMETGHFDGLFLMLDKHRFDYLPRSIYEIYAELEERKDTLENVVVEPTIALNIPMLSYVYVSPSEPRIAKRIKSGLQKLLANGELKELLYKHYGDDIIRANLQGRKIFQIENNYYNHDDNEYNNYLLYSK